MGFFSDFFEESEEELNERIRQAKKVIDESEKKLNQLKGKGKNNNQRPLKKEATPDASESPFLRNVPWKVGIIVLLLVLVFAAIFMFDSSEISHFFCQGENSCADCDVIIDCLKLLEKPEGEQLSHSLLFKVRNQMSTKGDCYVNITIFNQTIKKEYVLDQIVLKPHQTKSFNIAIGMPAGNSEFNLVPSCNYES